MDIGTGIFLSSVVLGIILLFIATKDRWNWKIVTLWIASGTAGLIGIVWLGFHMAQLISDLPRKEASYWDIPIGATKSDVKFLKGEPWKTIEDDLWSYDKKGTNNINSYGIRFKDGKIRYVQCAGREYECPSVQGINLGDSFDTVKKKFGEPSRISVSQDELARLVSYEKYYVVFALKENKVEALGIFDPSTGPMQFLKERSSP